jgi:hypothetical protein
MYFNSVNDMMKRYPDLNKAQMTEMQVHVRVTRSLVNHVLQIYGGCSLAASEVATKMRLKWPWRSMRAQLRLEVHNRSKFLNW